MFRALSSCRASLNPLRGMWQREDRARSGMRQQEAGISGQRVGKGCFFRKAWVLVMPSVRTDW